MNIYDKIITASFFWCIILCLCNPFLENKKMKYLTALIAVIGTIAFLLRP